MNDLKTRQQEIQRELDRAFGDYTFVADGHYYLYKGERVGISATSFIHKYVNEFESDKIAPIIAKKMNISLDDLLEQWDYKRDFSCDKGTTCHEYAQSLWSGNKWDKLPFDNSVEYNEAVDKIKSHLDNFYNDYKDKLIHIKEELNVGINEFDIASAIDHLFWNKEKNGLAIIDYKTNSYLKGYFDNPDKNIYRQRMKPPLQHLQDNDIEHYKIQLSIYRYFLEYYGFYITDLIIVYATENKENYEIIEIPYLKKEVETILEWRKWE